MHELNINFVKEEEKNEQTIVTPKVKVEQIIELSTESQRSPLSIQAI